MWEVKMIKNTWGVIFLEIDQRPKIIKKFISQCGEYQGERQVKI